MHKKVKNTFLGLLKSQKCFFNVFFKRLYLNLKP